MPSRIPRTPVPPSQYDRVYGNGDGALTLDERGVALMVETVAIKQPLDADVRTEIARHPLHPFRAGETYRDEFDRTIVRIYPGAVGMKPELVPYVVAHELGHVALGHLDRGTTTAREEIEADRFAGGALAEFGEDLEQVVGTLQANGGGDPEGHGSLREQIEAIRAGYREGLQPAVNPGAPAAPVTPQPEPAPPAGPPEQPEPIDPFASAFGDWLDAIGARGPR